MHAVGAGGLKFPSRAGQIGTVTPAIGIFIIGISSQKACNFVLSYCLAMLLEIFMIVPTGLVRFSSLVNSRLAKKYRMFRFLQYLKHYTQNARVETKMGPKKMQMEEKSRALT